MGRHSVKAPAKKPGRALILSIIAAFAVVGIVASGVFLWVGGHLNPLFAAAESGCLESEQLVVIADTSIAPALADIAKDFDEASETCVETVIKPQDSADTAAVVASGGVDADAWVPESSVWVDRMTATAASLGQTAPEVEVGEPIASTPVVFAAAATKAAEIASAPVTWTRVLGGALPTILPDPEASSASLAGLLALRGHSSPDDPRQFAGAMIELGKSIPASTSAAFGALATASSRAWSSRPRRRSRATTSTIPLRRSSRRIRPTAPCSSTTRSCTAGADRRRRRGATADGVADATADAGRPARRVREGRAVRDRPARRSRVPRGRRHRHARRPRGRRRGSGARPRPTSTRRPSSRSCVPGRC